MLPGKSLALNEIWDKLITGWNKSSMLTNEAGIHYYPCMEFWDAGFIKNTKGIRNLLQQTL
jgi:hypothetical protein